MLDTYLDLYYGIKKFLLKEGGLFKHLLYVITITKMQ